MSLRGALQSSVALAVIAISPAAGSAQQELPLGMDGPTVRIDASKPIFDAGPFHDSHFATSVWDLGLVVPVRPWMSLFAQAGLAFGRPPAVSGWSAAMTNVRVGALLGRDPGLHGDVHVDLPLAWEVGEPFALGMARHTNFEEWARYHADTWAVGGSATAESELAPGTFGGFRAGASYLMSSEPAIDGETLGTFGVFGDAAVSERARVLIAFSGVALLSASGLDFSERTTFFGSASVSLPVDRFAPEAYVRVPLDKNLAGIVSFVLGARLSFGSTRRGR